MHARTRTHIHTHTQHTHTHTHAKHTLMLLFSGSHTHGPRGGLLATQPPHCSSLPDGKPAHLECIASSHGQVSCCSQHESCHRTALDGFECRGGKKISDIKVVRVCACSSACVCVCVCTCERVYVLLREREYVLVRERVCMHANVCVGGGGSVFVHAHLQENTSMRNVNKRVAVDTVV